MDIFGCNSVFVLWIGLGLVGYVLQLRALSIWTSGSPRPPEHTTSLGNVLIGPFALIRSIVRIREANQEVNGWKENRAHWANRDRDQQTKVQEQTEKLRQIISQEANQGKVVLSKQVQGFDERASLSISNCRPIEGMDPKYSSIILGDISVPKAKVSDQNDGFLEIEMRVVSVDHTAICTLEPYGDYRAKFFVVVDNRDVENTRTSFKIEKGDVQVGNIYRISFDYSISGLVPSREFLDNDVPWVEIQHIQAKCQSFITGYNNNRRPIYTVLHSVSLV